MLATTVTLIPVGSNPAHRCGKAGQICFFTGGPSTVATAAIPAAGHTPAVPATLTRVARVAAAAGAPAASAGKDQVWQLELAATLRAPVRPGTVLVVVYDRADPQAIASHEVTALWDFTSVATSRLALRAPLDPEDGFHAGHTYLVRIVQLLGKREVVLAEGDVKLE